MPETTYPAVIVEDEINARQALQKLLELYAPEITVVGTAATVDEAQAVIASSHPQLLFLDIQLDKEQSFDLLRRIDPSHYQIIFVTAYNEYALEAFNYSALDYLLKPINPLRLQKALKKAINRMQESAESLLSQQKDQLNQLLAVYSDKALNKRKIILKERDMMHLIQVEDILWCEAKGSYTEFFLANQDPILVSKHLKEYEETLLKHGFFRIHRSFMVNLNKVRKIDRTEGNTLLLDGGHTVPVSVRRKEELLEVLNRMA